MGYNDSMMNTKGNEMKAGTLIRAFDFPGVTDCYFVGSVVEVKDMMITAKIVKVVSQGNDITSKYEDCDTFRTPVMGCSFGDAAFERIVVIG